MEAWQKISDQPLRKCPACGKMKLQKLISAVGFRLKGGGWYETDFKSDGKRNLAGDKPADKKADKAETKKADKPADAKKTPKKDKAATHKGAAA